MTEPAQSAAEIEAIARERVEERARARTDKLFLGTEVLGYDFQPEVHGALFASYIEFKPNTPYFDQSDTKNRMVIWSRGHYKTTSIVVEVIQTILNDPDARILLMQGSLKNTKGWMREIAAHFQGFAPHSRLHELFPEFCGTKKTLHLTSESFTVPCRVRKHLPQATVTCASPKSLKTGQHYTVGFFDDLVNEHNFRSEALIAKVREDFAACIPLIDPGGYRYVTGTRYAFGDLYEEIMRKNADTDEWVISVKDCWLDEAHTLPRFPQRRLADGRLIGFTKELLDKIKAEDPQMYSCQYLNRPISGSLQLFPQSKLLSCVANPADKGFPALSAATLFIDLAATDEQGSDDSVILCGKLDHLGNIYLVDGRGDKWVPHALAMNIIEMALVHRPIRIMFEKTASCIYFTEFLKVAARDKGVQLPIDYIKVNNQKDAKHIRITALDGHMRTKRLRFLPNLPCWHKMVQQFEEFPRSRHHHDDYIDTVALMCQHYAAAVLPVKPLSEERYPFLKVIETMGTDISQVIVQQEANIPDEMGDEFAC